MSDYYIGEITMFAGNYAPRDWMFCDGTALEIAQYAALYSLLGTTYDGNGTTYFNLPDLRDRFPMHRGNTYDRGDQGGNLYATLSTDNMPAHNHSLNASGQDATLTDPQSAFLSVPQSRYPTSIYTPQETAQPLETMHDGSIGVAGDGQPFPVIPPFLTVSSQWRPPLLRYLPDLFAFLQILMSSQNA
jgi:microcystin-dependent protein